MRFAPLLLGPYEKIKVKKRKWTVKLKIEVIGILTPHPQSIHPDYDFDDFDKLPFFNLKSLPSCVNTSLDLIRDSV